jgi:hypothetical protein
LKRDGFHRSRNILYIWIFKKVKWWSREPIHILMYDRVKSMLYDERVEFELSKVRVDVDISIGSSH